MRSSNGVGSLGFVVVTTQLDIACATSRLSNSLLIYLSPI